MPFLCLAQASHQDTDTNGTKSLSASTQSPVRKVNDRLPIKVVPVTPFSVYICLCKVTLELLLDETESISHAINLGCPMICLGKENVTAPCLSLKKTGTQALSLGTLSGHERPHGAQLSLLSVPAGPEEIEENTARSVQPRPNQQYLPNDSDL